MSWLFTSGGQSIEASALTSVLPMSIEGWFPKIDWMTPLIQWAWTRANSRRQWATGKPGMLQSMGLQKVGYNLATENNSHLWVLMTLPSLNSFPVHLIQFLCYVLSSLWPLVEMKLEIVLQWLLRGSIFPPCSMILLVSLCVCSISMMCGYLTFCSERKCLPPCISLLITGLLQHRTDICIGSF